jgi:small subunit ribosomal protein S15
MTRQTVIDHGKNENDTGATEVQVALLTNRINALTEHFKKYERDNNSKRSLLRLVGRRRRLLRYLQNRDIERYRAILQKLSLRK